MNIYLNLLLLKRVDVARRHLQMSIDWKGEHLGVVETRRHYTNYFKGIPHFKEYRLKLVTSDDPADVFSAFDEIQTKFGDARIPENRVSFSIYRNFVNLSPKSTLVNI